MIPKGLHKLEESALSSSLILCDTRHLAKVRTALRNVYCGADMGKRRSSHIGARNSTRFVSFISQTEQKAFIFGEKSNKHLWLRAVREERSRLGKVGTKEGKFYSWGENLMAHHFSKMLGGGITTQYATTIKHPPDRMH